MDIVALFCEVGGFTRGIAVFPNFLGNIVASLIAYQKRETLLGGEAIGRQPYLAGAGAVGRGSAWVRGARAETSNRPSKEGSGGFSV